MRWFIYFLIVIFAIFSADDYFSGLSMGILFVIFWELTSAKYMGAGRHKAKAEPVVEESHQVYSKPEPKQESSPLEKQFKTNIMNSKGSNLNESHSAFKQSPENTNQIELTASNVQDQEAMSLGVIESLDAEAKQYQLFAQCTVAESNYAVGRMYYYGTVTPIDYLKSLYYFYHAAQDNHAEACFMLGAMYFDGDGVEQNYSEAFKLFSKASQLGDVDGDYYLASMYLKGLGTDCNNEKAFQHAKKASKKGDAESIVLLAMMYLNGVGIEKDLILAKVLFENARNLGHQKSIDILNDMSLWDESKRI